MNNIEKITYKKAYKLSQKIHSLEAHILSNSKCEMIHEHEINIKHLKAKLAKLGYYLTTEETQIEKGVHLTHSEMKPISELN